MPEYYTYRVPVGAVDMQAFKRKLAAFQELYGSAVRISVRGQLDTPEGDIVFASPSPLPVLKFDNRSITILADGEQCRIDTDCKRHRITSFCFEAE